MRPIIQEDPTGCGIACAAMVAGKTYHYMKKRAKELGIVSDDRNLHSDTGDLRNLLASCNITIGRNIPFSNWSDLPPVAIVAVGEKFHDSGSNWHWVVYRKGETGPVVLDPRRGLRSNVRRDFRRLRPGWYVRVDSGRPRC